MSLPYCANCGTGPDGSIDVSYPMKCIKTGQKTRASDRDYDNNCDVFECQKCGARVAIM